MIKKEKQLSEIIKDLIVVAKSGSVTVLQKKRVGKAMDGPGMKLG